jgi:hypothetical protein
VLAIGSLVVLLVAAAAVFVAWPRRSARCSVTAAAVAPCGVWWGAALHATNSSLAGAVRVRDAATGRRLDIVHTYHRWYDTFPTASELAVAGAGHMLLLNWEPVDRSGQPMSWAGIAAGRRDAQIDIEARRLKAVPSIVFMSFSHEPEKDYRRHGTAWDFAAAFRHVHERMRADGVTNVRWVWDMMGLDDPTWHSRYLAMWPGDAFVDWVAWDPYNWAGCTGRPWRSFAQTARPFYDWLEAHGLGHKPFMLAEYGTVEDPSSANAKAAWLSGIPAALKALPNLRALVYFDLPAPPANCDWMINTSSGSEHAYSALARSSPFAATAKLQPE